MPVLVTGIHGLGPRQVYVAQAQAHDVEDVTSPTPWVPVSSTGMTASTRHYARSTKRSSTRFAPALSNATSSRSSLTAFTVP
jgi:hypothetical protein